MLTELLGKGEFGEVYLSIDKETNIKYATKKMKKAYVNSPQIRKYFYDEVGILQKMNHPNIVRLYEVKEDDMYYYLVFELCNGNSLSDCLIGYQKRYGKPFNQEITQYLMRQIVGGIKYLNEQHIVHRDLKLANILVNFNTEQDKNQFNMLNSKAKITDFGFARYLAPGKVTYSIVGTPFNMAPSILNNLNQNMQSKKPGGANNFGYDEKADIWSLGTICYELLIGKSTFDSYSMKELVQKVQKGNYTLPVNLSKEVVSFINCMLQYDPKKRYSAEELFHHNFLVKDVKDFTPIDIEAVKKKVERGRLQLNVKENKSIFELLHTDGEEKVFQIPKNQIDKINEKEEKEQMDPLKRINTAQDLGNRNFQVQVVNIAQNVDRRLNRQVKSAYVTNKNVPLKLEQLLENKEQIISNGNNANEIKNVYNGNENKLRVFQDNIPNKDINELKIKGNIEKEILDAWEEANNDFIYIERMFIPIIPGFQNPLAKFESLI